MADRTGPDWTGLDLTRLGLDWIGLDWTGLRNRHWTQTDFIEPDLDIANLERRKKDKKKTRTLHVQLYRVPRLVHPQWIDRNNSRDQAHMEPLKSTRQSLKRELRGHSSRKEEETKRGKDKRGKADPRLYAPDSIHSVTLVRHFTLESSVVEACLGRQRVVGCPMSSYLELGRACVLDWTRSWDVVKHLLSLPVLVRMEVVSLGLVFGVVL
jgi:hypothetical protein